MAKCPIYKIGGGLDTEGLTAVRSDVLAANTFLGSGSYDGQTGTIIERGNGNYSFPINTTYQLPEGHYTGGKISQSIATLGQQFVELGPKSTTVQTSGKYMTGNVIVYPANNLTSSNIKKGVRIQVGNQIIEGTWEGFINTDPFTPYYYGAFNGIQSVTGFTEIKGFSAGTVALYKDHFELYAAAPKYLAAVFNEKINITNKSKLTLTVYVPSDSALSVSLYRNRVTDYMFSNTSGTPNPNIGQMVAATTIMGRQSGVSGDYDIDLKSYTGDVYIYLSITRKTSPYKIYMVRFS